MDSVCESLPLSLPAFKLPLSSWFLLPLLNLIRKSASTALPPPLPPWGVEGARQAVRREFHQGSTGRHGGGDEFTGFNPKPASHTTKYVPMFLAIIFSLLYHFHLRLHSIHTEAYHWAGLFSDIREVNMLCFSSSLLLSSLFPILGRGRGG